jgi:hypothetical protein
MASNSNALSGGQRGQAYLGTNAKTPPNLWKFKVDPTIYNIQGFALGDFWFNEVDQTLFWLSSVAATEDSDGQQTATWSEISSASGTIDEIVTDSGTAFPLAGVITLQGGTNMNTDATGNVINVNLNDSIDIAGNINLPDTNAAGTEGEITFGGNRWISNFGSNNTFVGSLSGNTSVTGSNNIGLGAMSLSAVTTGNDNVAVGSGALEVNTTGSFNTAIGIDALQSNTTGTTNVAIGRDALILLETGDDNVSIGDHAGSAYTTSESSNICIGYNVTGTIAESNTCRIGVGTGTGSGQLNQTFIQGIAGKTIAASQPVFINTTTGQLGTVPSASTAPAFLAVLSATATNVTGNGTVYTVIPNTEISDRGANYNNATGVFTAPYTGYYQLWTYIPVRGATIATSIEIRIVTTSNTYVNVFNRAASSDNLALTLSVLAPMTAADTASIRVLCTGEAADTDDVFGDGTTAGATFGGVFIS